jgi:L-fucose isomerase-like protein
MPRFEPPRLKSLPKLNDKEVILVASGDLRLSANRVCWPAQEAMEAQLTQVIESLGYKVKRAHAVDKKKKHGFIDSQKYGMEVFSSIHPEAKVIVAEAVWQYSHHVLHGLLDHRGPILTLANWSGTWPGLVGMLNLNGSLTKANVKYSSLWGEDFSEPQFIKKLQQWLEKGKVSHSTSHTRPISKVEIPASLEKLGAGLASHLKRERAIMGVFDEGCMGMFNAIIPDHLLHATGVFKERLSQSALYYEATQVANSEAQQVFDWMVAKGMKFHLGKKPETELTKDQVLMQCKMYIAALRIADDFGCDTIGIQYQQGLKDLMPASDLVEGTLNNALRPPVKSRDGSRILYKGEPLPHFNEVDECAGLDGLMTFRVHQTLRQPVESTLHDLRWGDHDASGSTKDYVWVFLISGAAPPEHFIDGWKGASSMRQPAMYFPSGGGTLRGISKPGEIVWSRVFVANDSLNMDIGRGQVVPLPEEETMRRWKETTLEWPIMHAVTYGSSRDQMMARHKSNHIQVAYGHDAAGADEAAMVKAAMARELGMKVTFCGCRANGASW